MATYDIIVDVRGEISWQSQNHINESFHNQQISKHTDEAQVTGKTSRHGSMLTRRRHWSAWREWKRTRREKRNRRRGHLMYFLLGFTTVLLFCIWIASMWKGIIWCTSARSCSVYSSAGCFSADTKRRKNNNGYGHSRHGNRCNCHGTCICAFVHGMVHRLLWPPIIHVNEWIIDIYSRLHGLNSQVRLYRSIIVFLNMDDWPMDACLIALIMFIFFLTYGED